MNINAIPNKHLILHSQFTSSLPEYNKTLYVLDEIGLDGSKVTCCDECLKSLRTNRLPACSIANNFQLGNCPPEPG